jgi:phospholipid transport system substrate-binding protein
VLKTLDDPSSEGRPPAKDRRAAVRKIANDIFDFSETASARSAVTGRAARRPSGRVRPALQRPAGALLHLKVELYGGEKISTSATRSSGDQAKVQTQAVTKGGGEIPIEYRMHKKGDRWLVYDVVIEGVSLVANYRTQFNKIIQTSSFQELVKKMKNKQEELASGRRRERRHPRRRRRAPLAPLTDTTHKALLPLGGRPVLARMLEALNAVGVRQATLVVGHCADQVRAGGRARRPHGVRYIHNPSTRGAPSSRSTPPASACASRR